MAHHRLARACIHYFKVEEFAQYEHQARRNLYEADADLGRQMKLGKFSLLTYTVSSWIRHEEECEKGRASQDDLLGCLGWPSEAVAQRWRWLCRMTRGQNFGEIYHDSDSCDTILHIASIYGLTSLLRMALQTSCHIQPDALNSKKETPLFCAARAGQKDVVTLLLQNGADVNAQGGHHGNALQAAICTAWGPSLPNIDLLIQKGADPNANGKYGTAFEAAARRVEDPEKRDSVIKLLRQSGRADTNGRTNAPDGNDGSALERGLGQTVT